MQIPKSIVIKTAEGKTAAYLSPKADGLKDVYPDVRLNGESILEFSIPVTSEKLKEITPECQIWAAGRVYSLLKEDAIDFVRDENNKLWAKVMARERWGDLSYEYPEPYICNDPTVTHPADLTVTIVGGGDDLSGGRYEAGTSGHALYAVLDGSGWSVGTVDVPGIRDLEMEKANRLTLIRAIQEIWGGYLLWDSVNKTVSLRSGDIWQPYHSFQVRYRKNLKHITRTQSNRLITKLYCFGHDDLDIASVNDGKKYITNNSFTPREYIGTYKNQDIYDAQELKDKATAALELNCKPMHLYRVKAVDLRTLPEYAHEELALGDMADIIDADIAPDAPRPRIIRHKYNLFKPWECELEIGDPEERFIEKLKAAFDTTGFIDGKFNGEGKFSGHGLEYKSVGADRLKVNELVVGDNIAMGPNASISWAKVSDRPDIPDDEYITEITEDTLKTTNVYAKNLEVKAANITGILTASQIATNIAQVNNTLNIGDSTKDATIILGDYSSIDFQKEYSALRLSALTTVHLEGSHLWADTSTATFEGSVEFEDNTRFYENARFDGDVSFHGDVDFSYADVTGLDMDYVVEAYTKATKCILSATQYGLIVRDRNGNILGQIDYTG